MECRWIDNIKEFENVAGAWDRAAAMACPDNPFLLSDFLLSWWKYYGKSLDLRVFVICEGDNIVGGLPLYRDNLGRLRHLGNIAANYTEPFLMRDGESFWPTLFGELAILKGWRGLRLERVRHDRLDAEKFALSARGFPDLLCDIADGGPSYMVKIPEDFRGYIGKLPKKLRYYIKRAEEGLSKMGELKITSFKDRDEVAGLADKFIEFSISSFKGRNRESAFESEAYRSFFKELVARFGAMGMLDANALTLGGKPIAINFGYMAGNNLNYVFPSYDIALADLNPGHLLIYKLIELGSQRKNAFLDMYTGYQFYKEQWSDVNGAVLHIEIHPNTFIGKSDRTLSRISRYARSNSKIKNAARSIAAGKF